MYPQDGDTINTITKVRLPNGQDVGIVDWNWKPLYSTVDMKSGMTDAELYGFVYGKGDNVTMSSNFTSAQQRTATLKDTNIDSTSEMSSTEEMLVYSISLEVFQLVLSSDDIVVSGAGTPNPMAGNMAILHERLIVSLEVSEKDYFQGGFGYFPAGFGPNVSAAYAPAAVGSTRTFATNGMPSIEAVDRAPVPVHIGGTEKFKLIFANPGGATLNFVDETGSSASTTVMRTRAYFRGLYKRPVA